jgi:hypothetical protein
MAANTIRIQDLGSPEHAEAAIAAFAMIDQIPFELSLKAPTRVSEKDGTHDEAQQA